MDWDLILACEVQDLSKRRHAFSSYCPGHARSDQVCRVARENNTDVNAALLGPASEMKRDSRLRMVIRSPGRRDRQDLFHALSPLSYRDVVDRWCSRQRLGNHLEEFVVSGALDDNLGHPSIELHRLRIRFKGGAQCGKGGEI